MRCGFSKEEKEAIEDFWKPFYKSHKLASNALFFVQDYKRSYPYGKLLGQVLHTIREEKDAKTKQAIPTGGLEYAFNQQLQGSFGKRRMLRSPRYPLDRGDVIEDPINGSDVFLTINHHLQVIAEEEIEKSCEKRRRQVRLGCCHEPKTMVRFLLLLSILFSILMNTVAIFQAKTLLKQRKSELLQIALSQVSTLKTDLFSNCFKSKPRSRALLW